MKSREISRSKIGPFSLACTDPYIGIGWEYRSNSFPGWLFLKTYNFWYVWVLPTGYVFYVSSKWGLNEWSNVYLKIPPTRNTPFQDRVLSWTQYTLD